MSDAGQQVQQQAGTIQIMVKGMANKTTVICLHKDARVSELYQAVQEKTGLKVKDQRLHFAGKELRAEVGGKPTFLSTYHICNLSTVFLVTRLQGGRRIAIEITACNKSTTVTIDNNKTVLDLKQMLEPMLGVRADLQRLDSDNKTNVVDTVKLVDLNIADNSKLTMIVKPAKAVGRPDKTYHDGDSIPTTDEPCMLSWDDDPNDLRAKMPCGHAISASSLVQYCRSLLQCNRWQFLCPAKQSSESKVCSKEWQYADIRRYGLLTQAERESFESRINEVYLLKAQGVQQCPKCDSYCMRESKTETQVSCQYCTKKDGTRSFFCWACLHPWRNRNSTTDCGNTGCDGKDPRLAVLANATKRTIGDVQNVPGTRACVKCGTLIYHIEACKHMKCRGTHGCQQEFCFICLKPKVNGRWQCGSYNSKCSVAPVQTTIPSM